MASLWLLALLITVPLVLFIGRELLGTYKTYLFVKLTPISSLARCLVLPRR
jgi:hypothetical protein